MTYLTKKGCLYVIYDEHLFFLWKSINHKLANWQNQTVRWKHWQYEIDLSWLPNNLLTFLISWQWHWWQIFLLKYYACGAEVGILQSIIDLYQYAKNIANSRHMSHIIRYHNIPPVFLNHWGKVTYICVSKLNIASNNGLSPGRRQAIIWTSAGILWIWPIGTIVSEMLIEMHPLSFKSMHLKMSSSKWWHLRQCVNTLKPRQNGRRFAEDMFKCIFMNERFCISIRISLNFVSKAPIDNKSALVQIMGMAPNRRQAIIWTDDDSFTDAYMRYSASMS